MPRPTQSISRPPRVFLSYSHDSPEHLARVLALAARLRSDGIDAWLDQYEVSPPEVWSSWLAEQIEAADFVLVVCSEVYLRRSHGHEELGRGVSVAWESALLELSDPSAPDLRYVPIVFSPADVPYIPGALKSLFYYNPSTEEGYLGLVRRLTGDVQNLAFTPDPLPSLPLHQAQPQTLHPNFPGEDPRGAITRDLEAAYLQEEELLARGEDTSSIRDQILALSRELREGGRLLVGDFLFQGRFKLVERIGRGGFASVWKAFDRKDRQLVAVKILHGQFVDDRTRIERFFRGARIMASLLHPGIVRVLEKRCDDGGHHFFVMEYLSGDLQETVLAGRLSLQDRVKILLGVGEALQFAHQRGVVHRDIKPSNILLDDTGNPRITDFDLVRAMDTTGGTMTGGMLGTFPFAPPESLANASNSGPAADIYSLGMTSIFALRGAMLPVDVLRSPDAVIAALPVSKGCQDVLARAIKWAPEDRWPSVAEFCRALRHESAPNELLAATIAGPQTNLDALVRSIAWGRNLLDRLREDGYQPVHCHEVESGRWFLRTRLPPSVSELYGTAPEVLLLVVADQVHGGDLRRAQEELHSFGFELDLDLLVVVDGEPNLSDRLKRITQLWGQWVSWSPAEGSFPSLSERLASWLPLNDVFERQDPVRGRQVIGREETIADLSRRMLSGEALGVFGLRKMGKTTAVRAVTDRLDPVSARLSLAPEGVADLGRSQSALLVAWLDCQRVYERTVELLAELMRRELEERCDFAGLSIPRAEPGRSALNNLDNLLRTALRQAKTPVGLVLDEYDLLFEGSAGQPGVKGIETLFGMLRAHAQETGKLSLVVIGRDPDFFERPEMGGRANPMLQWFHPRWLGPMPHGDARELLQGLGRRVRLDIGERTAELARTWTGGHPLLHRQFGSALLGLTLDHPTNTKAIPTDSVCEEAVDPFLDRSAVITICREVFDLLTLRYPEAAQRLRRLSHEAPEKAAALIASGGGWHQPATKILRNFGILSGSGSEPIVPSVFRWYVQTFTPNLQRKMA